MADASCSSDGGASEASSSAPTEAHAPPPATPRMGHRAQKRVITLGLNAERLRVLRAGLVAARARVEAGCPLWTRLQDGLALAEREFAAENTLGLSPDDAFNAYPLAIKRQRRSAAAAAQPTAAAAAQPTAQQQQVARLTKRQWKRMGIELVSARLRQVPLNAPRLARAVLELDFPPLDSFNLPASTPKTPVSDEGVANCPTSSTVATIRCATCGIRHASRLGMLGTTTTHGCLCAPIAEVADLEHGIYSFDMGAYRCALDPAIEFANLKLVVKHHRGDAISIVTPYESFVANRRLVEVCCHACLVVVTRPCNKRLIFGTLECGCRRPHHARARGVAADEERV